MSRLTFACLTVAPLLQAGCRDDSPPPPQLEGINPSRIPQSVATPVVVTGRNFVLGMSESMDSGAVDIAASFELWLESAYGPLPLADIEWLSPEEIQATVPARAVPGEHDLGLRDALGRIATLEGALTVVAQECEENSACIDADPCTTNERCQNGLCVSDVVNLDEDGDGYVASGCGGDDCDDDGATGRDKHPGAPEIVGDGVDQDCDGVDDCYRDADGDGYGTASVVSDTNLDCDDSSAPTASADGDCDDDPAACGAGCFPHNPAPDICDGADQDCDAATDEDYVVDVSCGTGACQTNNTSSSCTGGSETPCIPGTPAADDSLCNGIDDDCADGVDEDYIADTSCGVGYCQTANTPSSCASGRETACVPAAMLTPDDATCDGVDDNCNGTADEGGTALTYYKDGDGDGFGNPLVTLLACTPPSGYVTNDSDCDDDCNLCWTGAPELCDSLDNDCDGPADEREPVWREPDYLYRRQLSFDNRGRGALTQFPVLVALSPANFDYGHLHQADGSDLRFVDSDGVTPVPYHIETWNPAGDSHIWAAVPQIDADSATDFMTMYYGYDLAADVQDRAGTWDASYAAVLHLDETSGEHVDATSAAFSCTIQGGVVQDVAGQIAGANAFDGHNDAVECGPDRVADAVEHTITAWVSIDRSAGSPYMEIVNLEHTADPFPGWGLYLRRNTGRLGTWHQGGYISATEDEVLSDTWTLIAVRGRRHLATGFIEVSKNGGAWERIFAGNTRNLRIPPGTPLVIGEWPGPGPNADTAGIIDEVRVSRGLRSRDWLSARYAAETGSFVSVGTEETECP